MNREHRPSLWFYVGLASLALAGGPVLFGFVAVLTWGLILLPLVALIWFGPWFLLHWVSWGRRLSQQTAAEAEGTDAKGGWARVQRPTPWQRVLRLTGGTIVAIAVVLYYLVLFGGGASSTEPRILHFESRPDGSVWLKDVIIEDKP